MLTGASVFGAAAFLARGLAVFAFALVSVFFGAAAFLVVAATLAADFLGAAAFLVVVAFVCGLMTSFSTFSAFGLVSFASFLGAAGFFTAVFGAFLASLTGPEGPDNVSVEVRRREHDVHTLWLLEFSGCHTSLDGVVEEAISAGRRWVDVVVCTDVCFDSLTTATISFLELQANCISSDQRNDARVVKSHRIRCG